MFSLRPGKDGNIFDCPKPKKPQRVELRLCPRDPNLIDIGCRTNTVVRGMLIKTDYCDPCEGEQTSFIVETFDGDCVVPINLECFCIQLTGDDRELVTITYEDVSDHYCSKLGKPVRLLKITRLWKGEVRTAVGQVRRAPSLDANGEPYFQIIDSRSLDGSHVSFIPIHTMGVSNDEAFMISLLGKEVSIVYSDFGKESPGRCGIPITIIELDVNE
jgi:hypothetical protein